MSDVDAVTPADPPPQTATVDSQAESAGAGPVEPAVSSDAESELVPSSAEDAAAAPKATALLDDASAGNVDLFA